MLRHSLIGLMTSGCFLAAPQVQAEPESWYKTQFTAAAGIEYDSNVGVPDLDQNTGASDEALVIELGGKLSVVPIENLTLRAGYTFDATLYETLDAFSLQTHLATLEGEYDFGVMKAGVLYNQAHARLDGDAYLDYRQISPNVSKLFGDTVFLRAAYLDIEKRFEIAADRDADATGGQLDAFVFLDGSTRYVILGVKRVEEDAVNDEFDQTETALKARYIHRIDLLSRPTKLRMGLEREDKDYQSVTESIGVVRSDEILKGEARAEIQITEPLSLEFGYAYTDRSSNLPSADVDEHVASARMVAKF